MRGGRLITFRVRSHAIGGTQMVEVWRGGEFVAGVYGHRDGIRVVSKYLEGTYREPGRPPAVMVRLGEEAQT